MPVPENTEYVSGTASVLRQSRGVSYRSETNQAEWAGNIPAGETAEITVEVRVNADAKRGNSVVISQGTVSYDGGLSAASAASGEMLVTVEGCLAEQAIFCLITDTTGSKGFCGSNGFRVKIKKYSSVPCFHEDKFHEDMFFDFSRNDTRCATFFCHSCESRNPTRPL